MGTRSITTFEHDGIPLTAVYRHWDGYPTGHGADLARWLNGLRVVNGPGRLAGRVVRDMYEDGHEPSIEALPVGDQWQEYEYVVNCKSGGVGWLIYVSVFDVSGGTRGEKLFSGTAADFAAWIAGISSPPA